MNYNQKLYKIEQLNKNLDVLVIKATESKEDAIKALDRFIELHSSTSGSVVI